MKRGDNLKEQILKNIFERREEELYKITEEVKENLKKKAEIKMDIIKMIEQLNDDEIIKEMMRKSIEKYIEILNTEIAFYNEKFYKNGFKDGIKFVSELIQI